MTESPPRNEQAERRQVAALPWRRGSDGLEILLVTSRETRRWVTPKGGRTAGKTDAEAAAQEALEEAGIEGVTGETPLGTFRYLKVLKRRAPRWCVVTVYGLEVTAEHGGPLLHADQAVACRRHGRPRRSAEVPHIDAQRLGLVGERDRGAGRAGVLERVRQGFLDDAVGVQFHRRGQRAKRLCRRWRTG